MKTKFATLVLCLVMSLSIEAQQKTDSFFYSQAETRLDKRVLPVETQGTSFANMDVNVDVPVGNGMFLLLGISVVYVVFKMKEVLR